MYPQVVNANDSSMMLGDTLFSALPQGFVGIPIETDASLVGLRYYLLILFFLIASSYLLGRRKQQLGIYLKMFLMPHKHLSYDLDTPINRFQNWFAILSFVVVSLFFSLLLTVDETPLLVNITWQNLWMSAALLMAFFLLKLSLNALFSWLHFRTSDASVMPSRVVATMNFMSMALILLMVLNEFWVMPAKTLALVSLIVYLLIKLISLPGLMMFFSMQRLSPFHSFLYLCGQEIIPLLLLGKGMVLLSHIIII